MQAGIILLGHGSRREEANEEIRQIAAMIKQAHPESLYETAFLSFGEPDLTEVVEKMIQEGIDKIIVMPLFLVTGNHITRDIPSKLLLQKTTHPEVKFVLAKHFGPHHGIVDIVEERIQEAAGLF